MGIMQDIKMLKFYWLFAKRFYHVWKKINILLCCHYLSKICFFTSFFSYLYHLQKLCTLLKRKSKSRAYSIKKGKKLGSNRQEKHRCFHKSMAAEDFQISPRGLVSILNIFPFLIRPYSH